MTEELNFTQKIIKAQSEMKVPKSNYNKFGKYNFRSAEDILESAKPVNAKYGLLLSVADELLQIGERFYIKATATITDGKDSHIVTAYAREAETIKGMSDSQVTGTASSYARKYALNGLYLIDDTKDADTNEYHDQTNNQQNNQPQSNNKMATDKQLGLLHHKSKELAELYDMEHGKLKTQLKIKSGMSEIEFKEVLKRITDGIEKAQKQEAK